MCSYAFCQSMKHMLHSECVTDYIPHILMEPHTAVNGRRGELSRLLVESLLPVIGWPSEACSFSQNTCFTKSGPPRATLNHQSRASLLTLHATVKTHISQIVPKSIQCFQHLQMDFIYPCSPSTMKASDQHSTCSYRLHPPNVCSAASRWEGISTTELVRTSLLLLNTSRAMKRVLPVPPKASKTLTPNILSAQAPQNPPISFCHPGSISADYQYLSADLEDPYSRTTGVHHQVQELAPWQSWIDFWPELLTAALVHSPPRLNVPSVTLHPGGWFHLVQ